jgi:transposase-like protein
MLTQVNLGGDRTRLRGFLLRNERRSDPDILKLARKTDPPTAQSHHLQVLSRAALLLRIGSGSCSLLFQNGGTSLSQLRFWWSNLGESRGCWERASSPQNVTDLWADIQDALDQLRAKQADLGRRSSLMRWRQQSLNEIAVLGECERIGLWGMNV